MQKLFLFLWIAILSATCTIIPSKKKTQFLSKPPSKIENELGTFIESHNWQYDGTEKRPVIAATAEELTRLKNAWKSTGANHEVLARRFAQVDAAIAEGISFPPEGGQHNQWYQCDSCQIGLQTVDAHHHKCPQCGKIYSGFPYDNVLYSRQHSRNLSRAEDAGWAWTITGEKKYAEFAASILLGYAERYLKYPMVHASVNDKSIDVAAQKHGKYMTAGYISEQTLGEAMLMIPAATAYDLIYTSEALKKEQKSQIEEKFLRPMAECINVYKAGKSNWQTWHNAALLYTGAVIGDKTMVKQAILDDKNGFTAQMKISVMPEGMWYENSWGYHYYTLTAMTHIAEGGRRMGMDLYSNELLRKMYLLAFDYRMADGSLPRFGDAVQDSPNNRSVNEKAYIVYHDDQLLATLPAERTWDGIMLGRKTTKKVTPGQLSSKLIPGAGHAILATDGPGKLTAAMTFGPYGGFHGHFDKLSFVFFGYGQELAVDPGRAASQAYRLPIHTEWYKATTGHNIVLADGKSQKEAGGQLLGYAADPAYAAVSADAGPAFTNVNHRRFLLLAQTYLLVVDELKASDGQKHSFDWLYHNKGLNISCDLTSSNARIGPNPPGYTYLKDITSFRNEKEQAFSIDISNERSKTRLTMLGKEDDEIFTATGPFTSVTDRVPMVIVRRNGETVHFISVMEPMMLQMQPEVKQLETLSANPLEIKITRTDGEDYISFPGESLEKFAVSWKSGQSEKKELIKSESN